MGTAGFTLAQGVLAIGAGLWGFYTGVEIGSTPMGGISGMLASWAVLGLLARLNHALERMPPCRCGAEDAAYEATARPHWPVAARCRSCGLRCARRGSRLIEILPDNSGQVARRQDFWLRRRPVGSTDVVDPGE